MLSSEILVYPYRIPDFWTWIRDSWEAFIEQNIVVLRAAFDAIFDLLCHTFCGMIKEHVRNWLDRYYEDIVQRRRKQAEG